MGKFLRFLLVGGSGFVIDAGLTQALIFSGMTPQAARIPAVLCAMLFTWLANRRFTYRAGRPARIAEAARYLAVALAMSAFNYAIYCFLVAQGWMAFLAIVVATGIQSVASFFLYQRLVFSGAPHLPR